VSKTTAYSVRFLWEHTRGSQRVYPLGMAVCIPRGSLQAPRRGALMSQRVLWGHFRERTMRWECWHTQDFRNLPPPRRLEHSTSGCVHRSSGKPWFERDLAEAERKALKMELRKAFRSGGRVSLSTNGTCAWAGATVVWSIKTSYLETRSL